MAWFLGLRLLIALTSDPNRTDNYSPLWLVIWVIGSTVLLGVIGLAFALGLRRRIQRKPSVWANLITIGIAGAAANLTVGVVANLWKLDTEGIWEVRAFGGFVSHILVFWVINNLRGAVIERNERIREQTEVEDQLLGYRESAKQIAQDAIESMRTKTIEAVTPSIERMNLLLAEKVDGKVRQDLIDELTGVIHSRVRPLSQSLQSEAEALSIPSKRNSDQFAQAPSLKSGVNIRKYLKIPFAFSIMALLFPMLGFLVIDHKSMFRGLLGAIAVALAMLLLRQLLPKTREFRAWVSLILIATLATVAVIPAFLIIFNNYGLTQEVINMTLWMVFTAAGAFCVSTYTEAVDAAKSRFEANLRGFNDQLAKEVSLFEQRLWLERRAWSYILHGDVQGALSAAVTRLQRSEKLEPYELELVKQDINRATEALTETPAKDVNFSQGIDELVRTWAGVCDIKVESSARASRAIESNRDIRNCINEICKEAISNAVRHGNSKNAWITISREQDDIIELEVCNDGHTLLRDQPNGMGLSMIDDLSLSWQLTAERHKGKTCLVAQLPISNKSL